MPFVTSGGVRIRYEVEGNGPPLLLHIGFIGAIEDWYDAGYVAALRDAYQLIIIDPRGQGQSDKPKDAEAYSRSERIGDVCAVLDAVGVAQAHYWGYSMGGQIGFGLGVFASDRVSSLILGGANPYPYSSRRATVEEHPMFQALQRGMAGIVASSEQGDPEVWARGEKRSRWLAADTVALSAAFRATFANPGLTDEVCSVQTPTLIYCGGSDDPEQIELTARSMPNASYVELEGLDHGAAFNRIEQILPSVTEFLAQVEQTTQVTP